jgi:hypothetical protein
MAAVHYERRCADVLEAVAPIRCRHNDRMISPMRENIARLAHNDREIGAIEFWRRRVTGPQ